MPTKRLSKIAGIAIKAQSKTGVNIVKADKSVIKDARVALITDDDGVTCFIEVKPSGNDMPVRIGPFTCDDAGYALAHAWLVARWGGLTDPKDGNKATFGKAVDAAGNLTPDFPKKPAYTAYKSKFAGTEVSAPDAW